ncbi:hypothetical protein [Maridesulfovibrio salexigens]|uniref:Uncharacterized protein n=1 Tax=Maridesulfovibrio salexigens (strain ATCC 14822 / DSM 2638 / NCIMB 8403 / VKM B-1763) TaxID=526222 RepID=C6C0F8_MARSD|nr:hypothetical protein [Maridesulfovibrio salexigens]ACS79092.1 hypothetical protein Desal_1027 [Maridesulfovibrio salexigens DSM 2638]
MDYGKSYVLRKKTWKELNHSLRMYGENEPPEMQIENMWKVVNFKTGEKLCKPERDLSEFERGDILYPTMHSPEVQAKWERNELEWKEETKKYEKIKRVAHVRFMLENPDLGLVQDLAKTEYGKGVLAESGGAIQLQNRTKEPVSTSGRAGRKNLNLRDKRDSNIALLSSDGGIDNLEGADYYWTMHPNSGACEQCQNMAGVVFRHEPDPVHPNCKCEVREHAVVPKGKKPKDKSEEKPKDKDGYPHKDRADRIKKALKPRLENWADVHRTTPGVNDIILWGIDKALK